MAPKPAGASRTSASTAAERSARAVATAPPSEWPTTVAWATPSARSAVSTSSAYAVTRGRVGSDEPPKPGRSSARQGRGERAVTAVQPAASSSRPCSRTTGRPRPGVLRTRSERPPESGTSKSSWSDIPPQSSAWTPPARPGGGPCSGLPPRTPTSCAGGSGLGRTERRRGVLRGASGAPLAAALGGGRATAVGRAGGLLGLLAVLRPLVALGVGHLADREIAGCHLVLDAVELGLTSRLISLSLRLRHIQKGTRCAGVFIYLGGRLQD